MDARLCIIVALSLGVMACSSVVDDFDAYVARPTNVATGEGGSLFQRNHRNPGTRPLAGRRSSAPPPSRWIA